MPFKKIGYRVLGVRGACIRQEQGSPSAEDSFYMSHETFRTCRSKPLHRKFFFPTSSTMANKNKKKKKTEAVSAAGTTDGTAEKTEAVSAAGTTDGASFKRAAWADLPIEVPSTDLVRPTDLVLPDIRNLIAELEASRDAVACGRWTMEDKCLLLSIMTRERAALMCRTLGMSGKGSRTQLIDRLAGSTFFQGWY